MHVYNHGKWVMDADQSTLTDEWEINGSTLTDDKLMTAAPRGINACMRLGAQSGCAMLEVFRLPLDVSPMYRFFAVFSEEYGCESILVSDFPSLLALVKEVQPVIEVALVTHQTDLIEENLNA